MKCAKISLKLICKDCQKILSEYQQGCRLGDGYKVDYFYKYSDIKELMFDLEEYLNDEMQDDLEQVLLSLAEFNYYNNTTK